MKWINIEDAMPEQYEEVLVWVIYSDGTARFNDSWWDDGEWAMGSAKGYTVTHWMRIEEPK